MFFNNILVNNLSFIIFNNNKVKNFILFFYNNNYCFQIIIKKNKIITINKQLNSIKLNYFFNNKPFYFYFRKNYKILFKFSYKIIKFNGRGFRFKFNKNNILLILGYSHLTYTKLIKPFKFIRFKNKIIILNYFFFKYNCINKILKLRFLNIFTNKGVYLNLTTIYKKVGKVSLYL